MLVKTTICGTNPRNPPNPYLAKEFPAKKRTHRVPPNRSPTTTLNPPETGFWYTRKFMLALSNARSHHHHRLHLR